MSSPLIPRRIRFGRCFNHKKRDGRQNGAEAPETKTNIYAMIEADVPLNRFLVWPSAAFP